MQGIAESIGVVVRKMFLAGDGIEDKGVLKNRFSEPLEHVEHPLEKKKLRLAGGGW